MDHFRNHLGQTSIEYTLLLFVVFSVTFALFQSPMFKDNLGQNGLMFQRLKNTIEYSYRHGLSGNTPLNDAGNEINYGVGRHSSYRNGNQTRFFGHAEPYN